MELFRSVDFLTLSIIVLLSLLIGWFIMKWIEFHVWKIPPGPLGIPLLGYAPFFSKNFHKDIARLNKTYGKVCTVNILSRRIILVSDYDTAKELLCHPAALSRPQKLFDFIPGKGGFVSMNSKQWATERRSAMQAVRNLGLGKELWDDIIREDIVRTVEYLVDKNGDAVDINHQLSISAMNSMMALVLGRQSLNELTDAQSKLIYEANVSFREQLQSFLLMGAMPWLWKLLLEFNIGGCAEKKKLTDLASEIFRNEIKKRFISEDVDDAPSDFIKEYVKECGKETSSKSVQGISAESLLGDVLIFVSTSDTTMVATLWMLFIMAAFPDVQDKVHKEMDEVIGRSATTSWEDRKKLPYTFACILEKERWVSVVPIFIPRCAEETFEFHGYSIPEGSMILTNAWAVHRDPKYWNHPDEYMPERFLKINTEKLSSLEGYAPFSFGKRKCPGERIATMITFLYFTGIMQRFQVRTPSGGPPDLTPEYNTIFEPRHQELCFIER